MKIAVNEIERALNKRAPAMFYTAAGACNRRKRARKLRVAREIRALHYEF